MSKCRGHKHSLSCNCTHNHGESCFRFSLLFLSDDAVLIKLAWERAGTGGLIPDLDNLGRQRWTAPPEPGWEGFTGVRGLGAPEGPGPPAVSVPRGWEQRGVGAGSGGCWEGAVRAWMWPRGPSSVGGSAGLPGISPSQSRPGGSEKKRSLRGSRWMLWGPDLPLR